MTERAYREHPAISRSELWWIRETPEKFKWHRENPSESTPALLFGQLLHAILLQPETVADAFVVEPECDKRTKAGREKYLQFLATVGERSVITAEMYAKAQAMCASVNAIPFARRLLNGHKEVPFFWRDEMTGEECKCRVDCLTEIGETLIIVDLKSTECAETEAFMRSAIKHGYDFQSAMYTEGVASAMGKTPLFVFIAVEKEPPYAVNILQADELFVRRGRMLFREFIETYHYCRQTDNWYGYLGRHEQINVVGIPAYLAEKIM